METMLFTERSIWTMVHGIVLGGGQHSLNVAVDVIITRLAS